MTTSPTDHDGIVEPTDDGAVLRGGGAGISSLD